MENVRRLPVGEDDVEVGLSLDDLAREGARRMIAAALEAEVADYIDRFAGELDDDGHRLVVRNGRARERKLTVGSGTVAVRAPRVNDKRVDPETGGRQKFSSKILPAYARRSPKVTEVLPLLYLHGLSTGDFEPALRVCSARTPQASRRPRSAGSRRPGKSSTSSSAPAACGFIATRTCSATACTSRFASGRTTGCACWWSSACARTA
jgi:hypothetical protein